MFFHSSERKLRTQQFDSLLENTHVALADPDMRAGLGPLAGELDDLFDGAFLPNLKKGQFAEPRSRRDTPDIAVIPMTDEEAAIYTHLIEPLKESTPLTWAAWRMDDADHYGTDVTRYAVTEHFDYLWEQADNKAPSGPDLAISASARSEVEIFRRDNADRYYLSRPILIVRDRVVRYGLYGQAAVMGHEGVHAIDAITGGPRYITDTYIASSELRGYHTSNILFQKEPVFRPEARISAIVENDRLQSDPDPAYPFRADDALIQRLDDRGVLR